MATRDWQYTEGLAQATTTSTSVWTTQATLTFTPVANKAYAIFWSASCLNATSVTTNQDIDLYDVTNSVELVLHNLKAHNASPVEWPQDSGFYIMAAGSSIPRSFSLRFKLREVGGTATVKNARLFAVQLTTDDSYAESLARSTTTEHYNGTPLVKVTDTITVPVGGATYLVFGNAGIDIGSDVPKGACEFRIDGASVYYYNDATGLYPPYTASSMPDSDLETASAMFFQKTTLTAGNHTADLRVHNVSTSVTVGIENARVLFLRIDDGTFGESFYTEDVTSNEGAQASTTSYVTHITASGTLAGGNYLVLGFGLITAANFENAYQQLIVDDTTILIENERETYSSHDQSCPSTFAAAVMPLAAGSHSLKLQYKNEVAGTTTTNIGAVLLLKLPAREPRTYYTAESLAEKTTTDGTNWTTQVTLTFTPKASTAYALFWSAAICPGSLTIDGQADFYDVTNATELSLQRYPQITTTPSDYMAATGMYFLAAGSAVSRSWSIRFKSESGSATTTKMKDGRIVAIELTAGDVTSETLASSTTSALAASTVTRVTANITVPTGGGDYLVAASCHLWDTVPDFDPVAGRIKIDGTVQLQWTPRSNETFQVTSGGDNTIRVGATGFVKTTFTAGSHTVLLTYDMGASSGTVGIEQARVLIMRLNDGMFGENFYTSYGFVERVGTTTYSNTVVLTPTLAGGAYLLLGWTQYAIANGTVSMYAQMNLDGASLTEQFYETTADTSVRNPMSPLFVGTVANLTAGAHTLYIEQKNETGVSNQCATGAALAINLPAGTPPAANSFYMGFGLV